MYSQKLVRPKWSLTKLVTISTFLGVGSYTFGFNQKLTAHFRFARSLENPAGFNQALRNVNARIGGPEHFPYGVPERRGEYMGVALGPGVAALSKNPSANKLALETTGPGEDWALSQPQEEQDQNQSKSSYVITTSLASFLLAPASTNVMCTARTPLCSDPPCFASYECINSHTNAGLVAQRTIQPSVQRPPNKWDEIRAANNKAGSLSSWDLIRQNHERNKISSLSSSQPSIRSRHPTGGPTGADGVHDRDGSPASFDSPTALDKNEKQWDSRALDEAQFEAVLEAERRRTSQA